MTTHTVVIEEQPQFKQWVVISNGRHSAHRTAGQAFKAVKRQARNRAKSYRQPVMTTIEWRLQTLMGTTLAKVFGASV